MRTRSALARLAEVSESQWGMVTTAQAASVGVPRLTLARLCGDGVLIRLAQGVYRLAGSPGDQFEDLRATWLSTDPTRTAAERLGDGAAGVVVSGPSAAWLHGIGDLRADRHEFTVPVRRQTQRPELRYRVRVLDDDASTIVEGLPVTTVERTITDLVKSRTDLSLVADALRDAAHGRPLDRDRLAAMLAPLAARNGFPRDDGQALLLHLHSTGLTDEPLTLADRLAHLRPEADFEWEPERTPMASRPVEF